MQNVIYWDNSHFPRVQFLSILCMPTHKPLSTTQVWPGNNYILINTEANDSRAHSVQINHARYTACGGVDVVSVFPCCAVVHIEEIGDEPLRNTLNQHGGWPVMLTDSEWTTEETWNVEVAMGGLVANFTKRVLVDIMVTTDDKNSSARVLQVR